MATKTEYKGVYEMPKGTNKFKAQMIINFKQRRSYHDSLKEAALQIDKWLILSGKEPVNILKRK